VFEDQRDGVAETLPAGSFRCELALAGSSEAVEFGVTPAFGSLPFGFEPASIFEAVERGIEGALADLEGIFGDLLDALDDGVPVDGTEGDDFQDEHVEGALKQLSIGGFFGVPRHSGYRLRHGYLGCQGVC
jgi:hypothetical protein